MSMHKGSLDEKFKDHSIKSTVDNPYLGETPIYSVDSNGIPQKRVLVDLEARDISAFHQSHEKELWLAAAALLSYFFLKLMSGI